MSSCLAALSLVSRQKEMTRSREQSADLCHQGLPATSAPNSVDLRYTWTLTNIHHQELLGSLLGHALNQLIEGVLKTMHLSVK